MEVATDLSAIFKDSPIERMDQTRLSHFNPNKYPALCKAIDKIGMLSATAQNLRRPLTSYDRFTDSEDGQILYIYWEKPENSPFSSIVGFLKIAKKKLYLRDLDDKQFIAEPTCVLDFYVHESEQKHEIGHQLFEKMLEAEGVEATKVAFDKPNDTLLSFLKKYYNLDNPVWQMTNYVVFPQFYDGKTSEIDQNDDGMFSARSRTGKKNAGQVSCYYSSLNLTLFTFQNKAQSHSDTVGGLINSTQVASPREKFDDETPRGRKCLRDYGHTNIFG